jgi:hypothetical protein
MFDYIALHGVWSWVSPENRGHIVRFAARYLKPGGGSLRHLQCPAALDAVDADAAAGQPRRLSRQRS